MKQLRIVIKDLRKEIPKNLMKKYEKEFLSSKVKKEKEVKSSQLKKDPDEDFLLLSEKPSKIPKAKAKREVLTPIIVGPRHKTKFSKHQCTICLKYFAYKSWLKEHIKLHYQPLNSECKKCKKVFPHKAYLTKHVCRSSTCPHCNKTLMHAGSLKYHLRVFHGIKLSDCKYECDCCGNIFKFKSILEKHLKTCSIKDKKKFECDRCGSKFALKCRLRTHMICHVNLKVECEICHLKYKPKSIKQHKRLAHAKEAEKISCKQCEKIFVSREALRVHSRVHNKKFKCQICGKKFHQKSVFAIHMELHENPDKYKCHICGHRTTREDNLRIHLETHNKNREKNIKCDRCNFKTYCNANFKIHLGYHKRMDEKLKKFPNAIKCKKCPSVSKNEEMYEYHLKKSHGTKKNFNCDFCGNIYANKSSLKVHIKGKHIK